jgi:hypothetical protein
VVFPESSSSVSKFLTVIEGYERKSDFGITSIFFLQEGKKQKRKTITNKNGILIMEDCICIFFEFAPFQVPPKRDD